MHDRHQHGVGSVDTSDLACVSTVSRLVSALSLAVEIVVCLDVMEAARCNSARTSCNTLNKVVVTMMLC